MTANSRPLHAHNAIEAALFVVTLDQTPDAHSIAQASLALDGVATELPGKQEMPAGGPGFFVQFGPSAPPFGEVFRFTAAPNGTHTWRVQLSGNMVQVACHAYTNFKDNWATASRYLRLMLQAMPQHVGVHDVGYQVVDKFLYNEPLSDDNYDMAELYRAKSKYITPHAWGSGCLWHVYQGWFMALGADKKMLHQLNLSNVEMPEQRFASVIDHRVMLQPTQGRPFALAEMLAENHAEVSLNQLFERLHNENKRVVRELLTPAKLKSIGIKGRA